MTVNPCEVSEVSKTVKSWPTLSVFLFFNTPLFEIPANGKILNRNIYYL